MKKRTFVSLLSFTMSIAVLFSSLALTNVLSVSAADDNSAEVEAVTDLPPVADISAATYAGGKYRYETLDVYTDTEAATAGVPEGYSGHVMKITASYQADSSGNENNETGMVLDFTSWNIKVEDITSMTVRYYVDSACSAIRLTYNETLDHVSWIVNDASIVKGQWAEMTVSAGFEKFANNDDGTLGSVALCFRHGSTFYVDSITFTLKETEATTDIPEITNISAATYAGGKYGYETMDLYTSTEASAAGVPEGYSDNVLKLTALTSQGTNSETGVVLDFTSWGIKVEDITSMTVRYYVDSDCSAIRLATNSHWLVNDSSISKNQWAEITITSGFSSFVNNDDGTLGSVALCFRHGSTFYVDSITFQLKGQAGGDTDGKDYFENPVGRDEIPYTKPNSSLYAYSTYQYDQMEIYTQEEAADAGVPEGYSGHVMMLAGTSEVGISMDFSEWEIPLGLINSMTFRVYVPEGIKEVRLSNTEDFIVRHVPTETDAWIDITLYPDGTGFNGSNFTAILNDDQTLGSFHFCLRYPNGTTATAYLDGFTFDLKENDGVAPVIQYKGDTTIQTSAGKLFVLQDLIAYDEQEDRYIAPVLTWSEGALDENSLLQKGNHTCVAAFTDAYGNKSEITLQLNVGDKDTEAPVIQFGLTTINATVGTRVDLEKTIVVTDNYDIVTPVLTWSEGALDAHDRLLVGTHTLTITATDLTGLQSQKIVTIVVTDDVDKPATPTPVN